MLPSDVFPDPRPARSAGGIGRAKSVRTRRFRQVASTSAWDLIHEAKDGPCLVCLWLGVEQLLPSSLHHVVSKSLGGDDVEENVVSLCGDGTKGHHGLIEAHDGETCRLFAAALQQFDSAAYAYAVERLGELRFLNRYQVVFTFPELCSCAPGVPGADGRCPEHGINALLEGVPS